MFQWIDSACSGATGRGRGRGGATGGGAISFHGRNYCVHFSGGHSRVSDSLDLDSLASGKWAPGS